MGVSGESFLSGLCGVRGGVAPRKGFLGIIEIEQRFIRGFSSDRTLLGRA